MRYARKILSLGMLAAIGGLLLTACDDGPTGVDDSDIETSQLMNDTLTQVDRFGLPAINTAFVAAAADKDAFNLAAPANDAQFVPVAAGVIEARYGVPEDLATALADAVLPDVQPLGTLEGYEATGTPFNGRELSDDVIDLELAILFGSCPALPFPCPLSSFGSVPALASDNVDANDVAFLETFPFLAPPHTP